MAGGECTECKDKKGIMQRKPANAGAIGVVPPIVHEVLRSPGQPLDPSTRAVMESRFGYNFEQVMLHTDAGSKKAAAQVNARAFTYGHHVVFGEDEYSPRTMKGTKLLMHELTHVVQQTGTEEVRGLSHESAEAEAEAAGERQADPVIGSRPFEVARAPAPPPSKGSNFSPKQVELLQQAREKLKPEGDAIVGVLIADDGRQVELKSGGGQGFSSHIEGKATAKMNELGIKKATLLSELEPCQLCNRSDYPAATGPETPMT